MLSITSVQVQRSIQDDSVNFIMGGDYPGYLEARYVRRVDNYFVSYLSSQSGCAQACRMCHLTITGQTRFEHASREDYLRQAEVVIEHYRATNRKAKLVHFGFMARGEPLDNPKLDDDVLHGLGKMAIKEGLTPRFCISTILPKSRGNVLLTDTFKLIFPDIYYSVYSMNPEFRKKWLPKALPTEEAFALLADYQWRTRKIIRLHWAFIKGENDSIDDMETMAQAIKKAKLRCDINIIKYNPFSEQYGVESDSNTIHRNVAMLKGMLPEMTKIKVIDRIGFDVKASCGMFHDPDSTSN